MIEIIVATRAKSYPELEKLPIGKSFHGEFSSLRRSKFVANIFFNNKDGLGKVYNEAQKTIDDGVIRVFMHDDLTIDCTFEQFETYINRYTSQANIVGLAGGRINQQKLISQPLKMWHLISDNYAGVVSHLADDGTAYPSVYGPLKFYVDVVDGLFIASKEKVVFDEQFTFHHYDIDACLTARKSGKSVMVSYIPVTHASPGLRNVNDPVFTESNDKFRKKYNV